MKSDLDIAREFVPAPIEHIAEKTGLSENDLKFYGPHIAKINIEALNRILSRPKKGKLVLVSAITPTPAGEGKTTTSVGLAQGLIKNGRKAAVVLREPSLGPVFGIKGGAAGGGYSQVLPMEDINLHFTGDLHAITAAHNLIAASLDNAMHFGLKKNVSVRKIFWPRVLDMNDRSLRNIVLGLGGRPNGVPRESGFDITAASEIMAVLCLSLSYSDLKSRIARIIVALTDDGEPVTVADLNVQGAVAALLKEALLPNLVQTLEGGPAFIHGGPFANIAQGANSIMATNLALRLSDIVVTEAGFGCDLGAEKFFDIVSPYGGFTPWAVVLVATVRALKMHGGVAKTKLTEPDTAAVAEGVANLEKHIENIACFNARAVVVLNRFPEDTDEEIDVVRKICELQGVEFAEGNHWADGGAGAALLAEKVADILDCMDEPTSKPLYDWKLPVEDKIVKIAREIYGARSVDFTAEARKDLKLIEKLGLTELPVCMAKTQSSLSDNPKLLGRPRDFVVTVRSIVISAGAGFLVPLTGKMLRMPGLPKIPSAEAIDIDDNGQISGLF